MIFRCLENIDRDLFLWLNGNHAVWLDSIMFFVSSNFFWLPVIVVAIGLIVNKYGKKAWLPILLLIFTYICTEQITNLVKHAVERYRPSHNIEIQHLVHTIRGYTGGMYGFFSAHAANSFGLALLSAIFIKNRYYTIAVLAWAIIVSYSRIYLGVHYPSDIVVGATVGIIVSGLFILLYVKINKAIEQKRIKNSKR